MDYDIVVVDEISMVPKEMVDLLMTHRCYILYLGDPFQIPPINPEDDNHLLDNPHVFLDQVMRQAAESEIIQISMKIRNQESLPIFKGNDVMIINKRELVTGHLLWADTIICATNNKRHDINQQKRQLLGHDGLLCPGEKILIKRNYWDDCDDEGNALVNGSICTVNYVNDKIIKIPPFIKSDTKTMPALTCNFTIEGGGDIYNIDLDKHYITDEEPCIDWRVSYQLGKLKDRIGDIVPKHATYGYALTGHAAQGSEWDNVLVIEENFPRVGVEHARWLYTSCTRSAKKLVLVKK